MSPLAPQKTVRHAGNRGWLMLALLTAAGPVCYGVGLWAASLADGRPASRVVCFDPAIAHHSSPGRVIAAAVMGVGASLFLLVIPWLLGGLAMARFRSKRATAGAWSLAANSLALVLLCLVLRSTVGISRSGFVAGWLVWTGVLCWAAGSPATASARLRCWWRQWGVGTLIGVAAVVAGLVLFHREHFFQCFNGDGTEQFELARGLRDHFLPYWEIEAAGRFGTYIANPTVLASYWSLPWQVLLGEGEPATRLPCWAWWLGVFAISLCIVQAGHGRAGWLPAVPLAVCLLLTSVWYTFYAGYYPYMTDPASPGVLDALFTLLILLALDCLRHGDCAGWVVSMLLASLVYYAGPVVFLLMAAAAWVWQPVTRRQLCRATLTGILVLMGIVCAYLVVGYSEGSLSGWWDTIREENVEKYFAPVTRWRTNLLYLGYFLLGCGAVPALGLLRGFRKTGVDPDTAWDRTVATVAVVYLLIILGAGQKNLHYLGPLLPLPVILWLRRPRNVARHAVSSRAAPLLATASLAVCLLLCWPAARPVFTLNRQLGAVTTFQTDSYEEACGWAKLVHPLYHRGRISWKVGPHTWLKYSELEDKPGEWRPLLVTDGPPPSQYKWRLQSWQQVRLYCNDARWDRWLQAQHPAAGPDRFPWIFSPIAIPPPPREDVP